MNTRKALITTSIIAISTIGMFVFAQQHPFAPRGTQGQQSSQKLGQAFAQQGQHQQDSTCPNSMVGTQTQQRLHSHDPARLNAAAQTSSTHNQTRQQLRDAAQCVLE
jgi:hypothetical protein